MASAMLNPIMQPSLLYMMHTQHRYYTSELGSTHRELGRQYKKLAKAELDLIQRHEKNLTRQQKKRLQWTRTQCKAAVKNLESQQAWLHDYLRQCNDLIASCEGNAYGSPVTPWSALPTMDQFSPMSGSHTPNFWSVPPAFESQQHGSPQYWDLSMLRERRESSSTPSWSADSGFYEVNPSGFSNPFTARVDPGSKSTHPRKSRKESLTSENDDVPELVEPKSPTQCGAPASSTHKRRYSEAACQLIESRLALPTQTHHHRGNSAGATIVPPRTLSVHTTMA